MLGHAHPGVVEAVTEAAAAGAPPSARPTEGEVLLAEAICRAGARLRAGPAGVVGHRGDDERHPAGPRLHRTGPLVKFAGNYHGHSDALLAAGGSGVATLGPARLGRRAAPARWPTPSSRPTTSVPELDDARGVRDRRAGRRQHGPGAPGAGLPRGLRAACDAVGALLIFDEVITGFRLGAGGASARFGVRPTCGASARSSAAGCPSAPSAAGPTSWSCWPLGPGVPGRHAVGEPAGHRGRPGRAGRWTPRRTAALSERVGRFGAVLADVLSAVGWPRQGTVDAEGREVEAAGPRGRPAVRRVLRSGGAGPGHRVRGRVGARPRPACTPACSGACSTVAWRSPPAPTRWDSPLWSTARPSWSTPSMWRRRPWPTWSRDRTGRRERLPWTTWERTPEP